VGSLFCKVVILSPLSAHHRSASWRPVNPRYRILPRMR
jgi:hypothetical protein